MQANGKDITVQANGINICYDDLGTGGVPLLLVHGFPFDKSMWKPQVDFHKSHRRVIAADIRGFGKSTTNSEKGSISLFADDLIHLMDALQLKKVIACGLSMGGYIVLDAVNRYPERFDSIVLCDTQCIADSAEGKAKRYESIKMIEAGGLTDFAGGFITKCFSPETLKTKKELVENIKNVILSTTVSSITSTLIALAERQERCSSLDQLAIPALVLCGAEDIITPLAQSEFLHHHIKDSSFYSISGAGHLSNLEQPEQFNRHLNDFNSSRNL